VNEVEGKILEIVSKYQTQAGTWVVNVKVDAYGAYKEIGLAYLAEEKANRVRVGDVVKV
jgi:hypothetical protein